MTETGLSVAQNINEHFARGNAIGFAMKLERMAPEKAAFVLSGLSLEAHVSIWEKLSGEIAREIAVFLEDDRRVQLMKMLSPTALMTLFSRLDKEHHEHWLASLDSAARKEVMQLLDYPEGSVGRAMSLDFIALKPDHSVEDGLEKLREKAGSKRVIYLVDNDLKLVAWVSLERLALSKRGTLLQDICETVPISVSALGPLDDVLDTFAKGEVDDIPVIDLDGHLIGHIQEDRETNAIQSGAMASLQSMVGASREERALSSPGFAFKKRMGWLQINLLTAFLAAAVVGIFEQTIAQITALAVLLPVVAGQSGNAGAQALAVTMRGLALREITLRHWYKVMTKEAYVGLLNGVAIALTCGLGVYIWSGSVGLVIVISSAMVLAMIAAGLAGALVPIVLTRFGQDPATASSIILTTVTDVAGFFAFLGIASLLITML